MRFVQKLSLLLATTLVSSLGYAQDQGNARGPMGPSPYDVVRAWHKPFAKQGFAFGGNSGLYAESPDRIFVLQRGETLLPFPLPPEFEQHAGTLGINVLQRAELRTWQNCMYTLDGDGNVKELWNQWDFLCAGSEGPGPHRIRISPYDPDKKVWVINETFSQIYVFSNDGSELLKIFGEKNVVGNDGANHLSHPQDVAFLPDGRVLIGDGLAEGDNNRIIILDKDLNYLSEFGGEGTGPGQFKGIHALGIGPGGRIFALDRTGGRINVFNTTDDPTKMEFVAEWGGFTLPLDIIVNEDDVWVTDLTPLRFVNLDFEGNYKYTWLVPRDLPDGYIEVHTFTVDQEGSLYGGDNQYGRTQKFVPKADANPELLIQRPWVAP